MHFNLELSTPNLLLFMLPESSLASFPAGLTPDEVIKQHVIPQMFSLSGAAPTLLDHTPMANKIKKKVFATARKMGLGVEILNKRQAHYKLISMDETGTPKEFNVYFRPMFMRRGCANMWPV